MRPVKGLDRPLFQWLLIGFSLVLVALLAVAAVSLRQSASRIRILQQDSLNLRLEREEVEARLARERATREALGLELARQRAGGDRAPAVPTLTLTVLPVRTAQPPQPGVTAPAASRVVELRLVLPRGAALEQASVTVRDWSSGRTVWSRFGLQPRVIDGRKTIAAYVTGEMFGPGTYEVVVAGPDGQMAASYELAVTPPAAR